MGPYYDSIVATVCRLEPEAPRASAGVLGGALDSFLAGLAATLGARVRAALGPGAGRAPRRLRPVPAAVGPNRR